MSSIEKISGVDEPEFAFFGHVSSLNIPNQVVMNFLPQSKNIRHTD